MGTISKNQKTKRNSAKTYSVSKNNRTGILKDFNIAEEESLRAGIKKYGRDAYKTTLSKGIAATVLEGNKICKISPDGKKTVLAQVRNSGVKVTRRSFKIE